MSLRTLPAKPSVRNIQILADHRGEPSQMRSCINASAHTHPDPNLASHPAGQRPDTLTLPGASNPAPKSASCTVAAARDRLLECTPRWTSLGQCLIICCNAPSVRRVLLFKLKHESPRQYCAVLTGQYRLHTQWRVTDRSRGPSWVGHYRQHPDVRYVVAFHLELLHIPLHIPTAG
jgi:hypothetical protein